MSAINISEGDRLHRAQRVPRYARHTEKVMNLATPNRPEMPLSTMSPTLGIAALYPNRSSAVSFLVWVQRLT